LAVFALDLAGALRFFGGMMETLEYGECREFVDTGDWIKQV